MRTVLTVFALEQALVGVRRSCYILIIINHVNHHVVIIFSARKLAVLVNSIRPKFKIDGMSLQLPQPILSEFMGESNTTHTIFLDLIPI